MLASGLVVLVAILLARFVEPSAPAPAPTVVRSLVVLPLEATSAEGIADFLPHGIADELATALASVPGVRVAAAPAALIPRPRTDDELRELASLLNVGTVVQGTLGRAGKELRVMLRLISVGDDTALWSSEFTRDTADLRGLENVMAVSVATVLHAQLGVPETAPPRSPRPPPASRDARAHILAMRAAYLQERGGHALDSAVHLLEEVVRRDSLYARAWSALASLLVTVADSSPADVASTRRKAITAARRAMTLDSTLAQPHVTLARVHVARGNTQQALREYLTAIRLEPGLASARYDYSRLLSRQGRLDEALREARRAHELDPLAHDVHRNYVQMLDRAGHQMEARHEMAELRRMAKYLGAQQ